MARPNQSLLLCAFTVFAGSAIIFMSRNVENIQVADRYVGVVERTNNLGKRFTDSQSDSLHSISRVEADRQLITRFQQRKSHLQEHCALIRNPDKVRDVALHPPEQLIVNEELRIIYCNVPKVACTNWKTVFLKLGGFEHLNTSRKDHMGPNAKGKFYLDYLHKYPDVSKRRFMLHNYTKFLFVRHPFTRVLSAFQNKLAPNISFYFRHGGEREQWVSTYGKRIINRYRGKSEAERVSSNWEREYDLTFAEFIRFLVDPDTDSYNKHWGAMHELCLPCDIDYDIIGRYETMNEDADFILRLANVHPDITFPRPNPLSMTNSSNPRKTERFYEDVPNALLYKLAMFYSTDFNLFGYNADPYLKL